VSLADGLPRADAVGPRATQGGEPCAGDAREETTAGAGPAVVALSSASGAGTPLRLYGWTTFAAPNCATAGTTLAASPPITTVWVSEFMYFLPIC